MCQALCFANTLSCSRRFHTLLTVPRQCVRHSCSYCQWTRSTKSKRKKSSSRWKNSWLGCMRKSRQMACQCSTMWLSGNSQESCRLLMSIASMLNWDFSKLCRRSLLSRDFTGRNLLSSRISLNIWKSMLLLRRRNKRGNKRNFTTPLNLWYKRKSKKSSLTALRSCLGLSRNQTARWIKLQQF